jgi:hypothetical protein
LVLVARKSGVKEIRCQFIKGDPEGNPVSVHHSCPER